MKIISVVGARPNFIKIKPVLDAFAKRKSIKSILVHTGQHYDALMSRKFFKELNIPKPDINLDAGSGTHGKQTAKILEKFERVLLKEKPDCVLVVGDVNSTFACSLAASKLGIKIAHVEAGKRSYNRAMPEEINRVLTDQISDYLFVPSAAEKKILRGEGIAANKIHVVGNVMADTLLGLKRKAVKTKDTYGVLTLHRPHNVDDKARFKQAVKIINTIARKTDIIFPAHPRTVKQLKAFKLKAKLSKNVKMIEPVGYKTMVNLVDGAQFILTDSGGLQAEAVILKTPCITLRDQTEWTETLGWGNTLTGLNERKIKTAVNKALAGQVKFKTIPYWDGKSAERIARALMK